MITYSELYDVLSVIPYKGKNLDCYYSYPKQYASLPCLSYYLDSRVQEYEDVKGNISIVDSYTINVLAQDLKTLEEVSNLLTLILHTRLKLSLNTTNDIVEPDTKLYRRVHRYRETQNIKI